MSATVMSDGDTVMVDPAILKTQPYDVLVDTLHNVDDAIDTGLGSSRTERQNSDTVQANSGPGRGWVKPCRYALGPRLWVSWRQRTQAQSKHQLERPPAWASDVAALQCAQSLGAKLVRIEVTETRTIFEATTDRIWHFGFELDRGFGRQVALPLAYRTVRQSDRPYQLTLEDIQ